MAVAGINNVSVLESSFFGDNYSSAVSRRWGNQEKPITRTSFIRKLWRDLEDESKIRGTERKHMSGMTSSNTGSRCSCSSECAVSETMSMNSSEAENECPWDQNQRGIQNEHEENQKSCFQHSPAIGTADKERVRRVFREWRSKSINGRALNASHDENCSRAQLVCEDESKRVRTVRQWLESNNQHAETGQSISQEQDALGVNETKVDAQRPIRKLYGRHALLDLLTRFQTERKKEVQSLLDSRPVSTFSHRKRIQTLLKGRFLWNQRFVQEEKSSSTAANELGLLRQTQTVSDLRKGFLSKVNNHEQAHDGLQSDTSSDNGMKEQENQLLDNIVDEFDTSSENDIKYQEIQLRDDIVNEDESDRQQPLPTPTESFESREVDQEDRLVERNHCAHMVDLSLPSLELNSPYESDGDVLEEEAFDHLNSLETDDEVGSIRRNRSAHHIKPLESDVDELEEMTFDHLNLSETYTEVVGSVEMNHGAHSVELFQHQQSIELKTPYESDGDDLQDETLEPLDHLNPSAETDTESDPNVNPNSTENPYEWLNQETVHDGWYDSHPVVTTDAFHTHDVDSYDGNNTRVELHQLVTRRPVSNLLQSDFRVRLDQTLQSLLERQQQASDSDEDWMLDENENENGEADESTDPTDIWQHSGTEWEIISSLRMDMLRLQERVNSMQTTLETCMKMQLELQKSVQQEVSSALNRSSNSESFKSCFLCSDNGFDKHSSHDRSGDVYICANCAHKINWSTLKESVGRP